MILVTGASGFIGSNLLASLVLHGEVRCFVRPSSASKIQKLRKLEIFAGDLRSKTDIQNSMKGIRRVIHLAAQLRNVSAEEIQAINVESTRQLVDEAKLNNVEQFIFVSSENALREDLNDPYAKSKRDAENLVGAFKRALILRPCFVYGRGDHHGLGRLIDLASKTPVVPLFGGIQSKTQPLYIDDMIQYLKIGLDKNLTGEYVLAGLEKISINDFIIQACEAHKKKRLFLPLPYALWRLAASRIQLQNIYAGRTYDISKTITAFGYAPRPLRDAFKQWAFSPNNSLPA